MIVHVRKKGKEITEDEVQASQPQAGGTQPQQQQQIADADAKIRPLNNESNSLENTKIMVKAKAQKAMQDANTAVQNANKTIGAIESKENAIAAKIADLGGAAARTTGNSVSVADKESLTESVYNTRRYEDMRDLVMYAFEDDPSISMMPSQGNFMTIARRIMDFINDGGMEQDGTDHWTELKEKLGDYMTKKSKISLSAREIGEFVDNLEYEIGNSDITTFKWLFGDNGEKE